MVRFSTAAIALLGAVTPSAVTATGANPVRKVVTLLQKMQAQVVEEGKTEKKLFDEYMCYCKTGGQTLELSIQEAKEKIEAGTAAVKEASELKTQLESDLKKHKASRDDAKQTLEEAKALRDKEAAAFAKVKADSEANIAAIKKAVAALEQGAGSSFLQTPAASAIRTYAMERANLPDASREELVAFLSSSEEGRYAPQSGEITGILKQMGDEMSADLADDTKQENDAIKNYEELTAAKEKEVETLQAQIEDKSTRLGNIGVEVTEKINDIEDTKEALAADEKYVKELEKGCSTKEAEWEEVKKMRAEELVAIGDTIKVLNDDDALDLFKQTLPSAGSSFLQVAVTMASQKNRALQVIRRAAHKHRSPALDLIALALNGKAAGFDEVIKMIDTMMYNLEKEQASDDNKKEYCEAELDKTEDKKKELELALKDAETAIDKMKGDIEKLTAEIAELEAGIKSLDKSVGEATTQRKEQNADYKKLMASDGTAKEVLLWAKNRLNKFYNPKLHKAAPKAELSAEDRISDSMGVTMAPEAAGGIAGTGIGAFVQIKSHSQLRSAAAPPPPPETFGAYTKKSGESTGVLAMIDLLVKDLDKEMQEADVVEKNAQADYEQLMADASNKRADDSKLLTEKTTNKANTEAALEEGKDTKRDTTKSLMDTVEYLQSVHSECDWLLKNYGGRKDARAGESDALSNAKAVLSGADYSFLQLRASEGRSGNFMARRR